MSERILKGALIGAGRVSQFHLTAWAEVSQAEICAIADPSLAHARARAVEFGIAQQHVYTSIDDLLRSESNLEFVDITTPPSTHLGLVKSAAARGLAINCQKPFAFDLKQAREMIDISDAAGVLLNIYENWRWRSWYRDIKSIIEKGRIGKPVYARFFVHTDSLANSVIESQASQRFHRRTFGVFMDWGIHHIDTMRFLFGEPSSVYMRKSTLHPEVSPIEERVIVVVNYPVLTAILDMSVSSHAPWGNATRQGPMVEDVRIEGDLGTVLLVPDPERGDRFRLITHDDIQDRPAYSGTPQRAYQKSYTDAIEHFVNCLLSGVSTETEARDNLHTLAITLAAYESARLNQVVYIESFMESSIVDDTGSLSALSDDA